MTNQTQQIKCPNCGFNIDVNEIMYHDLEDKIKQDYNAKLADQKKTYEANQLELERQREEIAKEKEEIVKTIESSLKTKLAEERAKIIQEVTKNVSEEKDGELQSYKEQLEEKAQQIKELNTLKADHERLKREKEELKDKLEAEAELKISKTVSEARAQISKDVEDKFQLKIADKEHTINQLNEQLKEAQRKAEQGSMQSQGEVQEIAIEAWLRSKFPLDEITEIKKGARGADCIQTVNTQSAVNCGSIYYESKRTKDFQRSWIEKFKTDMRGKGATLGVLVSDVLPNDWQRLGRLEGVWVCTFEEFKSLCFVLRESLIEVYNVAQANENKGDKMSLIYSYLTSNEFKLQIEAIVEGFVQMQTDLESEKRAIEGIWKKREKQIQKVLLNTNHMYHSIKGIAGASIAPIKMLELPEPEEDL